MAGRSRFIRPGYGNVRPAQYINPNQAGLQSELAVPVTAQNYLEREKALTLGRRKAKAKIKVESKRNQKIAQRAEDAKRLNRVSPIGKKIGRFKGRRNAQVTSAFLNILPSVTMNMNANKVIDGWNALAGNPNASRLSNREQSEYVRSKAGPAFGGGGIKDYFQRQARMAELHRKLTGGKRPFGYGHTRSRGRRGRG